MSEMNAQTEELIEKATLSNMEYIVGMTRGLSEEEKGRLFQKAVHSIEQALNVGLSIESEISWRVRLGNLFFEKAFDSNGNEVLAIAKEGISRFPNAIRAERELEIALSLDRRSNGVEFKKTLGRSHLAICASRLGFLWYQHSLWISKHGQGPEASLAYMKERVEKFDYLDGNHLPDLCNRMGNLYIHERAKVRNEEQAIYWFKRSIAADDFRDQLGFKEADSVWNRYYSSWKSQSRDSLEGLSRPTQNVPAPNAPKQESSGGCFIATATYGSPLAPEVMIFRRFRDETLLSSKLGVVAVDFYYATSPPLAAVIAKSRFLKSATRKLLLEPILRWLKAPASKSSQHGMQR